MSAGTFLVFWLWDQTLGNNLAWLESLIMASIAVWLFRDHIGRHLAAWFHKHHTAHLATLGGDSMTTSAQGEDRSSFQRVTNWNGFDFGFVKATEGTGVTDPTFAANWANLKAEGKPRGAYHFLHPGEDVRAQATHFCNTVKAAGLEPGDMLVVDSELPADNADAATKQFLDLVLEDVGHHNPLIVYTMHEVGQHLTETAKAYPLVWFAWPSSTAPTSALIAPWSSWLFWQWGQAASVDRDAYNGTAADLKAFIKRYLPKPPPKVIHWRVTTITSLAKIAPRHHMTPEQMIQLAAKQGHKYGPAMQRYIKAGKWNARLPLFTTLYAYAKESA